MTLAYLPYALWQEPINRFDLRRQNAYVGGVLRQAETLVQVVSFLDGRLAGKAPLPDALEQAAALVSLRDTQYTLQVEQVTTDSDLYRLRLERNRQREEFSGATGGSEAPRGGRRFPPREAASTKREWF